MAWSMGLMMVGGSGGAAYTNLPEADAGIADVIPLVKALAPLAAVDAQIAAATGVNPRYGNLTDYRFDFASEGVGFSPGIQLGMSYQASPVFSVSFGARFIQQLVAASSTLQNVEVYNANLDAWYAPGDYLRYVASDPNLNAPFPQVLTAVASGLDEDLAPVELDMTQYGIGLTPIIGLAIRPSDRMNVGMRYEHNTAVTMRTRIGDGKDAAGRFEDGAEVRADLPGFFSLGAGYSISNRLEARIGIRYMFDTNTDWEGRDSLIEANYYELSIAGQYLIGDRIRASAGYTYNRPSVSAAYQQETDYRLPGHTFAAGGAYAVSDRVLLNAGIMYTYFTPETNAYDHAFGGNENQLESYNLTFEKSAIVFAIGVDWYLPRKKKGMVEG
jgi:long-subunit fatty acid transport protein